MFFSVLIGAAQFGQVGPNVESFARARGAAYFIYQVIHRQPTIDCFSEEGGTPKVDGVVDFKDCYFNYPSRPDVSVRLVESPSVTLVIFLEISVIAFKCFFHYSMFSQ